MVAALALALWATSRRPLVAASAALGCPAQEVALVGRAGASERIGTMPPRSRALAVDRHGALWALLCVEGREGPRLWLARSRDGGADWERVRPVGAPRSNEGSITVHPDGGALEVVYTATDAEGHASVFHQTFDVTAARWLREPEAVLAATGPRDQYYSGDAECAADGTLCATVTAHEVPQTPGFHGQFGGGLLVRGPTGWQPVYGINDASCCGQPQIACVGTDVHVTFVTLLGKGLDVAHRVFDLKTQRWRGRSTRVSTLRPRGMQATNALRFLAVDGWLYCTYVLGADAPGRGAVYLASSRIGSDEWHNVELWREPSLVAGGPRCMTLAIARGPGDQAIGMFLSPSVEAGELLVWTFLDGRVMGDVRRAATAPPGVTCVNGLRTAFANGSLAALVSRPRGAREVMLLTPRIPLGANWLGDAPAERR